MTVDHIGYLVREMERGLAQFEALGYTRTTEIIRDDAPGPDGTAPRNVALCFLQNGALCVELVAPLPGCETTVVDKILQRQGDGPYHICYRTADLAASLAELKAGGWMILQKPAPAVAFGQKKVAFLLKKNAGMIELVERV